MSDSLIINKLTEGFAALGLFVLDVKLEDQGILFGFATKETAEKACAFFTSKKWDWVEVVKLDNEKCEWYVKAEAFADNKLASGT